MTAAPPPAPKSTLRSYFVTGLLIWVPLVITLWVINLIVSTMDQTLLLLPEHLQPERLLGRRVPGVGVRRVAPLADVRVTITDAGGSAFDVFTVPKLLASGSWRDPWASLLACKQKLPRRFVSALAKAS